jgi:hypothetical protein
MWRREKPGYNKTLQSLQVQHSEDHNYLFNMAINEEKDIMYIKEKSVFND